MLLRVTYFAVLADGLYKYSIYLKLSKQYNHLMKYTTCYVL